MLEPLEAQYLYYQNSTQLIGFKSVAFARV